MAGAGGHSYSYDQGGRITNWTSPAGAVNYSWDKAGNRTAAGATSFTYDARNRQTTNAGTAQTFTPKGDLLTGGLVHDTFGRLTSDGNVQFTYDGAGRPVSRNLTGGPETDRFAYLAASTAISMDGVARYANTVTGDPLAVWRGGTTTAYLGTDRHGDVVTQHAPTTGNRTASRAYDPFGATSATLNGSGTAQPSAWAGALGFQSDWTDPATARVNMGARWYTPTSATFTTRDTTNLPISTHIAPNRYTYANANPLTYFDPTGRCNEVIGGIVTPCPDDIAGTYRDPAMLGGLSPAHGFDKGEICPSGYGCDFNTGVDTGELGNRDGRVIPGNSTRTVKQTTLNDPSPLTPNTQPSLPPQSFAPTIVVGDGCQQYTEHGSDCLVPNYQIALTVFDRSDPIRMYQEMEHTIRNQVRLCSSAQFATLRANGDPLIQAACNAYEQADTERREATKLTVAEIELAIATAASLTPVTDVIADSGFCIKGGITGDKLAAIDCVAILGYNSADASQIVSKAAKAADALDSAADTAKIRYADDVIEATNTGVRSLAGAGDELAQGGVYALRDPVTGQVVRTGRTNDLLRRQGEHFRDPALSDFEFEVIARTDVYAQQRGLEQLLHDAYSPALNRINPISPTNPNRGSYLNAAEEFLSRYGGG
ncbi:MAG: hypothetical protein IT196_07400 [Acidimicrobiales bacterium]|nr:hypothetical protein [Acidimicrobiales bacterium]